MLSLFLAILCSTWLLLVLKYIERRGIDKLPVIVINYFVCGVVGTLASPEPLMLFELLEKEWLPPALVLGSLFICVFYMVAVSTQTNGIAITAVAFKLSMVIPIVAAYFLYGDRFNFLKIAGIALAIAAIFLTSKDTSSKKSLAKGFAAMLPALVFVGSGISDSLFNYIQKTTLPENHFDFFLIVVFVTAGIGGLVALIVKTIRTKTLPPLKAVLAGIILGVPNYGSAYFMLVALDKTGIESSTLWALNNIGVILISTLSAALLFRERINRYAQVGIAVAVLAIVLIMNA